MKQKVNTVTMKRHLGCFGLASLGIGAIIGAGVFIFTGVVASNYAGPAVFLSFLISGFACLCVAICYGELAQSFPEGGSYYLYTNMAFGRFAALCVTFFALFANIFIISSAAKGVGSYFSNILNLGNEASMPISVLAALVVFGLLYSSSRVSFSSNNIAVICKLTVLAVFVLCGLFYIDSANFATIIPPNNGTFGHFGISGVVHGASMAIIAYNGFDVIASASPEAINPRKNIPRAILIALLTCILIYSSVAFTLTGLVNYTELNVADPVAIAADRIKVPYVGIFIKIGAILGLFSVMLSTAYGSSRVIFAMAKDGFFFQHFENLHNKYKTPYIAVALLAAIVLSFVLLASFSELLQLANFCAIIPLFAVCMSLLKIKFTLRTLKIASYTTVSAILGIVILMQIVCGTPLSVLTYFASGIALCFAIFKLRRNIN